MTKRPMWIGSSLLAFVYVSTITFTHFFSGILPPWLLKFIQAICPDHFCH